MKTLVKILFSALICTAVSAQPMSVEDFSARFDQELEKINQHRSKQAAELNLKYLGALLRLENQAKNQGDLELVEAVHEEIVRVENKEAHKARDEQEDALPAELQEMRKVMLNMHRELLAEEAGAVVKLVDNLKEYTAARSAESTRQNDIPRAVAWRDWAEKVMERDAVSTAYARTAKMEQREQSKETKDLAKSLRGNPANIIDKPTKEFAGSPRVYKQGFEPKGTERRIQNAGTPSAKGAGHTKLSGQVLLISDVETITSDRGYRSSYKEKSHTYVPRIKLSPLIGKNLDRTLVVFDLYKRGSGSKRGMIRTDKILLPPLNADDKVVVDAGRYVYETEEYNSSWSEYDYKNATAEEFYGYIVTIFDKDGEIIFQRTSERILNDYARETPP